MKAINKKTNEKFQILLETILQLRSEKGCPWDKKQTSQSLTQYILEEAYEVVDAINNKDDLNLKSELGDLLFQVIFQVVIKEEEGKFNLEDILENEIKKLKSRHPHVFKENNSNTTVESVEKKWGEIKKKELGSNKEYIKKMTSSLPSLSFALDLFNKSNDINIKINEENIIEKNISEILELQFKLSAWAYKNKIDLETEYRRYLKAKQLDIITSL
jgi:tetrapyrrole methylase family protein/MazG family protein